MTEHNLKKIVRILMALAMGLVLILFGRLCFGMDVRIMNTRGPETYQAVSSVSYKEISDKTTPQGVTKVYRFPVSEDMCRGTHLAFYTVHQYVDVFIGQEHVYSLAPKPHSGIKTTGSAWTVIPLYQDDAGKEVTVQITPVYAAYRDFCVEFLVGSGLGIYTDRLAADLPQLIVSGLTILCGLFLSIFGVAWHYHKNESGTVIPLGLSAVGIGMWRLFDTAFSPFMAADKPVLLFSISITMLMVSVLPLVVTLRDPCTKRFEKPFSWYLMAASVILVLQIFLQLVGLLDLRDTLTVTHILIVSGALLVVANKVYRYREDPDFRSTKIQKIVSVMFVLGALADLVIYYISNNSANLLFTLLTFVVYVVASGVDFLVMHNHTKRALMEKEKQLLHVQTTMMFSQIRSHFTFNILNAISGMCKYDPEMADKTIVSFARYLRTNVETIHNDELIPFRSALRQLLDYVDLEQIRFPDKLRFDTDITVDDFLIPPLLLQPIVENAIRHGINPKKAGGRIMLRTFVEDSEICIQIQDNGVGFYLEDLENEKSTALKNIRFRLEHMIGGRMEIESRIGEGTTVTLRMPRKEEDR